VVAPRPGGQDLAAAFLLALQDHPALGEVEEFFAGVEPGNQASFQAVVHRLGAALTLAL
jgi:hypothetical protein